MGFDERVEEVWESYAETENAGIRLIKYVLVSGISEEFEKRLYGIAVELPETGERAMVNDLTIKRDEAVKFLELIARNTVTPVSLRDVAEDWAAGQK